MVVAMLGTLKAGGAYLPIDLIYPKHRRTYILQDAKSPVIITQSKVLEDWPELRENRSRLVCMDSDSEAIAQHSPENPPRLNAPNHLVYVLFTSGSTGRPKGVAIEHRSVLSLAQWARAVYSTEEMAGVLFATSICFDLSFLS